MADGTTARTPSVAVLAATLGLAAACWVGAVRLMTSGMDMGAATSLGTFADFLPGWVLMMTAMMLPAAAPAVVRHARTRGVRATPLFVAGYLAVWTVVGFAVYALYRPHGPVAAGILVLAAGIYEFTPAKRHCRHRCSDHVRSGSEFGLYCLSSNAGLMVMLLALGPKNVAWMGVIAVLMVGQRLLPAKPATELPVGIAIVGLGVLILAAPSVVPGLMPTMPMM
jgi:predicted metal-binding membrane protein